MRIQTTSLVTLLLFVPGLAAAQAPASAAIDDVRKTARGHIGPLYLTPALQLKELGIDTNVFNEAGEQRSDFMFNVAPALAVWVPIARRALLSATAATELVWYRQYDSERSINPQITGRAEIYLHRLTLFAGNAYLNTRQRPSFEIDLRSRHLENTTVAGAEYRITPKLSIEAAGRRGIVRYDADAFFLGTRLQEVLDRETRGVSVVARHRVTPLTAIVARVERSQDEFRYSPRRNTATVRVMPGIELSPRALISGSAYVGFRRFTPADEAALPEYAGLVSELGLSHTIAGATTVGVSFDRDVHYSFEPTQPYYVSNSVGAAVRRALGRRFDVLVSADRHTYSYRDVRTGLPGVFQAPIEPRLDTTWNYAGSLGYRLGRSNRVGLGVSYWQRESTTAAFREYDGLRVGTTVTYGF